MMLRTPLIVFAAGMLLWTVQAQLNHYISIWQLSVMLGGLPIAFAGLRLGYREGVRALLLTGFWFDAASPVPFGMHAFLFVFAHTVIHSVRGRLAREEPLVGTVVAALSNLVVFIATTAVLVGRNPEPLQIVPRIVADSLVSLAVIAVIAPWFFAFCEHALAFFGVSLRREQRGVA
jgi:hypothetical protein